jgi:hypothetical protein
VLAVSALGQGAEQVTPDEARKRLPVLDHLGLDRLAAGHHAEGEDREW